MRESYMQNMQGFLVYIKDDLICAATSVKLELRCTQLVENVAMEIHYKSQAGRIVSGSRVQVICETGLNETMFPCNQARDFENKKKN